MPEKLHRCVDDLKAKGSDVDNEWAVCNASIHEFAEVCKEMDETVAIPGSLSGTSIGAQRSRLHEIEKIIRAPGQ